MELVTGKGLSLLLFILILTIFSLVVTPGYESFTSDQTMFLPPMLRSLDPSLFPNGDLAHAQLITSDRSLISDLLAFFVSRGANLLWLLFILSAVFRALLFIVVYYLILYFTQDRARAALILLFFLTAFFIPGTGTVTTESLFTYRTVAVPFGFLYLVLYLYGWRLAALAPLLFAFSIHAVTALPFFCFHYLHTTREIWQKRKETRVSVRDILVIITPIIGVLLFLWWRDSGVTNSFFLRMDADWKQLANPRNQQAFFVFWSLNSYISLISWLLLGSIPLLYVKEFLRSTEKRVAMFILLGVPILMLGLAAAGEYSGFHGIIKLNLPRSLLLISFVVPILVGMFTLWHTEQHRRDILKNTFLLAMLVWFLPKDGFVFLREGMLLFIPSLAILFYGQLLLPTSTWRSHISILAVAAFALADGAVIYRSLFYGDVSSIIWLHLVLSAGWALSTLYAKGHLSSSSLAWYGLTTSVPFLIITSLLSVQSFTIYPKFFTNAPYTEACAWVEEHTTKDSVFIVEPFVTNPPPEDFRLACFRPIFTTYREGGVVPYDEKRAAAFTWKRKYDLVYAIQKNPALIEQAKRQYRLDYIFSETPLALPHQYPLAFSNDGYYIYDIHN